MIYTTLNDLNVALGAMGSRPYNEVAAVVTSWKDQAFSQLRPAPVAMPVPMPADAADGNPVAGHIPPSDGHPTTTQEN